MREISLPKLRHTSLAWTSLLLACALAACSGKPEPAGAAADAGGQAATDGMASADAIAEAARQSGFVQVQGTQFVLDGKPYRFAGANFWYGAYLGAPGERGDRARLVAELDQL